MGRRGLWDIQWEGLKREGSVVGGVQERRQTTQDLFVTVEVKMCNLTRQFTRSDDRQNMGDRSTCCVINVTNKMSLPVSARQSE